MASTANSILLVSQELEDLQKEHDAQREALAAEKRRLFDQQENINAKLKIHEDEIEAKQKRVNLEKEKVRKEMKTWIGP